MELLVVSKSKFLTKGDLLIDSSFLPNAGKDRGIVRIDHHVDFGWTMLDSIARVDWNQLRKKEIKRICTSYLDPDAIIASVVLVHAFERNDLDLNTSDLPLLPIFYSASFFADYSTAPKSIDESRNQLGAKLELWIRDIYGNLLEVEDRFTKDTDADLKRTEAFAKTVHSLLRIWRQQTLPPEIRNYNVQSEMTMLAKKWQPYIRDDLSTDSVGVIEISSGQRRGTPRAYYCFFKQPLVLRVLVDPDDVNGQKQMLLGVNTCITGWKSLDLTILEPLIAKSLPDWSPDGRREVIGNPTTLRLNDVMAVLGKIDLESCRNQSPHWTAFNWA